MKRHSILLLAVIVASISCYEQKDNKLANTCWNRYDAIYYDENFNPSDSIPNYTESGFTFYFFEKDCSIALSSKFKYRLEKNKLYIGIDQYDIVELNDTLMIALSYDIEFEDNELYPYQYNYFKKIDCGTLPEFDPDTLGSERVDRFKFILKNIFK